MLVYKNVVVNVVVYQTFPFATTEVHQIVCKGIIVEFVLRQLSIIIHEKRHINSLSYTPKRLLSNMIVADRE